MEEYEPTLKELRISRGKTQIDMAKALCISKQRYSRIEKNFDKVNLSLLKKILKVLNYNISVFFK